MPADPIAPPPSARAPVVVSLAVAAPRRLQLLDDAQALLTAAAFIALGTAFLRHARLLTGGVTGVALLLARVTPLSFGQLLVLANLPFLWLAIRRKGWPFTARSLVAVLLVSVASDHLEAVIRLDRLNPVYAAAMGGVLFGIGLLILFRHQASLGGLNVLALLLQERYGIRAGLFQMGVDAGIVAASLLVAPPATVALSVLGAVALNLVLAVNHRPGPRC